jgi:hypothetical protein
MLTNSKGLSLTKDIGKQCLTLLTDLATSIYRELKQNRAGSQTLLIFKVKDLVDQIRIPSSTLKIRLKFNLNLTGCLLSWQKKLKS